MSWKREAARFFESFFIIHANRHLVNDNFFYSSLLSTDISNEKFYDKKRHNSLALRDMKTGLRDMIVLFVVGEMEVEKSGKSGKITKRADKKDRHGQSRY